MSSKKKIVSIEEIAEIAKRLREEGKTIVTTNGVFDIIHRGHVQYLEDAKKKGHILIVGINSDESVKRIKGEKRPLNAADDRARAIAGLQSIDYVVIFSEDDPRRLLEATRPHIHIKGGDYTVKEDAIIEKDTVESAGGRIELVAMEEGFSTTSLIEKVKERYC